MQKTTPNASKPVRVNFYNELTRMSKITGISKAKLLSFAWEEFKKTNRYSKTMLGIQ